MDVKDLPFISGAWKKILGPFCYCINFFYLILLFQECLFSDIIKYAGRYDVEDISERLA